MAPKRDILPKPPGMRCGGNFVNTVSLPSKRTLINVACSECRVKKAKVCLHQSFSDVYIEQCTGDRPRCNRCVEKNLDCSYETNEGETRFLSLKRKHKDLEREVQDLRLIYEIIRNRSEQEAFEIFQRIRRTSDPMELLKSLKEADILLSALTPSTTVEIGEADASVEQLDADALDSSLSKFLQGHGLQ